MESIEMMAVRGLDCGTCEIRACGLERGVVDCAHCADYACEKLEVFFGEAAVAHPVLDEIRTSL